MDTNLSDADGVIRALGGSRRTADLCGVSPTAVSNWRVSGVIPARYYAVIQNELPGVETSAFAFVRVDAA